MLLLIYRDDGRLTRSRKNIAWRIEIDIHQLLSLLSGIIFAAAFLPYIIAILRRQTVPSTFTWGLWALLDIVTFVAMIGEGAQSLWLVGMGIAGASTVTLLSLKFGERSINKVNITCTIMVILAVICKTQGAGMLALVAGLVGLMIAAITLIINAWKNPASEDRTGWILFVLSGLVAMVAVSDCKVLADILPPMTFSVIDITILSIVVFRPKLTSVIANV